MRIGNKKAKSFPGEIYRMAINPAQEEVYFLIRNERNVITLNKISIDGSSFRPLGPMLNAGQALEQITGFEIRPEGDIWIMNKQKEEETHEIYKVDPDYQLLSMISKQKMQENARNCSCMSAAPYQISTRVYDDKNLNEKLDVGERYLNKSRLKGKIA